MEKCGDEEDCISTSEAAELAAALKEKDITDLPLPGQVDFINGGPPCQVCADVGLFFFHPPIIFILYIFGHLLDDNT